jgi:hypothetical protein
MTLTAREYAGEIIAVDSGLFGREMTACYLLETPRILLYVAYAQGGVVKLDWSDVANPVLLQRQDTAGKAVATAIANGRVYVADYSGGLVVFKK